MIVGTPPERPVIFARALLDWQIVDAGDAPAHQAVLVEFPVLVAVAAEPGAAVVVPFIGEAHGDAVLAEGPDFLDQAVVELALPFARQERFDLRAAVQEFGAVASASVDRIGECDALRIARVPAMRTFWIAVSRVKGGSGGGGSALGISRPAGGGGGGSAMGSSGRRGSGGIDAASGALFARPDDKHFDGSRSGRPSVSYNAQP